MQFILKSVNEQPYSIIVFSKTYDSPFEHLEEIAQEIRNIYPYNNITVLFDTLLSIGNCSDRFIEATFDGLNFTTDSFKITDISRDNPIRSLCSKFFYDNSDLLKYSILTPVQKKLLLQGKVI